jgi:hypothetical protein
MCYQGLTEAASAMDHGSGTVALHHSENMY